MAASLSTKYRKSGNFHVKIIHVVNIHVEIIHHSQPVCAPDFLAKAHLEKGVWGLHETIGVDIIHVALGNK